MFQAVNLQNGEVVRRSLGNDVDPHVIAQQEPTVKQNQHAVLGLSRVKRSRQTVLGPADTMNTQQIKRGTDSFLNRKKYANKRETDPDNLARDARTIEAKKGRDHHPFDFKVASHKRKERIRNALSQFSHMKKSMVYDPKDLTAQYQKFLMFKRSMKSMDTELREQIRLKKLKKRRKAVILQKEEKKH